MNKKHNKMKKKNIKFKFGKSSNLQELKKHIKNKSGQIDAYQCDVTNLEQVKTAFKFIESKYGGVNILINNAGSCTNASILDEDSTDGMRNIFDLNVMGVIYCTKEAYAILNKTNDIGHIVNISSIAGHAPVIFDANIPPNSNVYAGTKHALRAITETLRRELHFVNNKNIKISMISPGLVRTEIFDAAGFPNGDALFQTLPVLEPEDIADTCLHIIGTPPRVQIHDVIIKPAGEKL